MYINHGHNQEDHEDEYSIAVWKKNETNKKSALLIALWSSDIGTSSKISFERTLQVTNPW